MAAKEGASCPACGSDLVTFAAGGAIHCAACKAPLVEKDGALESDDTAPTTTRTARFRSE